MDKRFVDSKGRRVVTGDYIQATGHYGTCRITMVTEDLICLVNVATGGSWYLTEGHGACFTQSFLSESDLLMGFIPQERTVNAIQAWSLRRLIGVVYLVKTPKGQYLYNDIDLSRSGGSVKLIDCDFYGHDRYIQTGKSLVLVPIPLEAEHYMNDARQALDRQGA